MLYRECTTEIGGHKRDPKIETLQQWCLHKMCVRDRYHRKWWMWKVSERLFIFIIFADLSDIEWGKESLEIKVCVAGRNYKYFASILQILQAEKNWQVYEQKLVMFMLIMLLFFLFILFFINYTYCGIQKSETASENASIVYSFLVWFNIFICKSCY